MGQNLKYIQIPDYVGCFYYIPGENYWKKDGIFSVFVKQITSISGTELVVKGNINDLLGKSTFEARISPETIFLRKEYDKFSIENKFASDVPIIYNGNRKQDGAYKGQWYKDSHSLRDEKHEFIIRKTDKISLTIPGISTKFPYPRHQNN